MYSNIVKQYFSRTVTHCFIVNAVEHHAVGIPFVREGRKNKRILTFETRFFFSFKLSYSILFLDDYLNSF
jgi:hypothetical protein